MATSPESVAPDHIVYPERDGQSMSGNTQQFRRVVTLAGNLQALFRDRPYVFVSGNQNWYPLEGRPDVCAAPDVYAVFGRPKGERGSRRVVVRYPDGRPFLTLEELARKVLRPEVPPDELRVLRRPSQAPPS